MSYFYDNQNVQTALYAAVGSSTLTLSNFYVIGGATLTVTSLAPHFHLNYATNAFLSNTTGFYPPGADTSLTYTPRAQIPAFTSTLSANQLINSASRGFYVVVIGGGGGGGGARNNTADDNGNGGASGGSGAIVGFYVDFSQTTITIPTSVLLSTQVVESPHPYTNSYTQDFTLTAATATSMSIAFDPTTATEAGYDYVRFYSDAARTVLLYQNAGTSWPSVDYALGTIYGRFTTDTSVTATGFKLTATFYATGTTTITTSYTGAYYRYITGTGGTAGALGTNATGGVGGNASSSVFQLFNSSNVQIFSITAGGGTGGGGGKQVSEQPPPAGGGTGGTITATGTAAGISTDTINVRTNGTPGGSNNVNAGGNPYPPVFALQASTASGAYNVVGTTGAGGRGGQGDGIAAPNGTAGYVGNNGGIILFELF